ncbi:MAG: hypothetical protein WD690_14095 [Vicinamibacterales bacterium]
MRLRTSAAIGLVLALLGAPVAALPCTFQCAAAQALPAVSANCHGAAADDQSAETGIMTGAHDCTQRAQFPPPALRAEASRSSLLATAAVATGTFVVKLVIAGGSIRAHVSAHDLAPPGAAARFIEALRI